MPFTQLLTDTMDIQEHTRTRDSVGQIVYTWSTVVSGIPCRMSEAPKNITTDNNGNYKKESEVFIFFTDVSYAPTLIHKRNRILYKEQLYYITKGAIFLDGQGMPHHIEAYATMENLEPLA